MRLVSELRRRNVLRMAVLYLVAAWLIMQVAEVIIGLANLPEWFGPAILALLAIGFPIALLFSWFYELTAEGISLEKDVAAAESITHVTGRRMDFIVISLLCAGLILFAYDKWWIGPPDENSIAVLAFENMSGDVTQEYFSDGISEELLNLLARVPDLRVISRTSAFYFKDKEVLLTDIAKQLNVAYILEGSVRKEGDVFRITAQLIHATTDTHVWSQTYERELSGIFSVQDDIAREVVNEIEATLLGNLPRREVVDPNAYVLVLEAEYFRSLQTSEGLKKAKELYDQTLQIEPRYARAWAGLSRVYKNQVDLSEISLAEGYHLAEGAARKAIEVDQASGEAYASLAQIILDRDSDLATAARYFEKAMLFAPEDARIRANAGIFLQNLGRLDEAIQFAEAYARDDPVNAIAHFTLGNLYLRSLDLVNARSSLSQVLALSSEFLGAHYLLGVINLLDGDPENALRNFNNEPDDEYRIKGRALSYFDLGMQDQSDSALSELISDWGQHWPPEVAHVYAYRGEIDKAFEWLANENESSGGWGEGRYEPLLKNLHNDPRWESFLDKMGLSNKDLSEINFEISILE